LPDRADFAVRFAVADRADFAGLAVRFAVAVRADFADFAVRFLVAITYPPQDFLAIAQLDHALLGAQAPLHFRPSRKATI
jgi:hypothetical protein